MHLSAHMHRLAHRGQFRRDRNFHVTFFKSRELLVIEPQTIESEGRHANHYTTTDVHNVLGILSITRNKIHDMTCDLTWCDVIHDLWHDSFPLMSLQVISLGVAACNDSTPIMFCQTNHDPADHVEAVTRPQSGLVHHLTWRQRWPIC